MMLNCQVFFSLFRANISEISGELFCLNFNSNETVISCKKSGTNPYLPSTMLQTKKTQVYISEELAAPFECWEKVGY